MIPKDLQYYKFSAYGFLKNLRFFDPFIILFFLEMGINFIQIGTLFAIREITTNILEIPTGVIADAFGRRRSMIASFTFYIVSFFIFYLFPGFVEYIVAMLFFSLGEAFRTGTHKAMILRYLELENISHLKVHYYGHTRSASQLGSAVSSIMAAAIVILNHGSYRIVFLASVIPYILELFLMISYPRQLDGLDPKHHDSAQRAFPRIKLVIADSLRVFTNLEAMKSLLNSAVYGGLYKGLKDFLQPMIKSTALTLPVFLSIKGENRSVVLIGGVYFLIYLATSFTSRKSGHFAQRLSSVPKGMNLTYAVGVLFLLGSGLLFTLKLYAVSIVFFVVMYIVESLRKPLNIGYISEQMSSGILATGLSGESQLKSLFTAIFSFSMGFLAHVAGIGPAIVVIAVAALAIYPFIRIKLTSA
jgi:MFS family permease